MQTTPLKRILFSISLIVSVFMAHVVPGYAIPSDFTKLVKPLLPAVVNISTTKVVSKKDLQKSVPQLPPGSGLEDLFKRFFDALPQKPKKTRSLGSGFIIDADGFIVTNNHVIKDADEITVILNDGEKTELKAKVVGRDHRTDIALLKVSAKKKLPFVKWGDSKKAEVGQWVITIGNPFGLASTVTAGIISTIARDLSVRSADAPDYIEGYIQTDAAINLGNSGGPMFDMNGEVIGVNTAIISPTGGHIGLGFSIPSDIAQPVVEQLKKFGRTKRGWLGVGVQKVTDEIASAMGLKESQGALVGNVYEKSPAFGKVVQGDIITKFNNEKIKDWRHLPRIVGETNVGTKVPVEIIRNGKPMKVSIMLGEFEQAEDKGLIPTNGAIPDKVVEEKQIEPLGLKLQSISPYLRERYKLNKETEGVLIVGVDDESEAAEKGLKDGDVLVKLDNKEVKTPEEVNKIVQSLTKAKKKHVLILLNRDGNERFLALPLVVDESKK